MEAEDVVLRSRMGKKRLTSGPPPNLHRDVAVSVDDAINRLAKAKL